MKKSTILYSSVTTAFSSVGIFKVLVSSKPNSTLLRPNTPHPNSPVMNRADADIRTTSVIRGILLYGGTSHALHGSLHLGGQASSH